MIKGIKQVIAINRASKPIHGYSKAFVWPVRSALIVVDSQNLSNLPELMKLKKEWMLKDPEFKTVLFTQKNECFPEFNGLKFGKDDFNLLGNLKTAELKAFADQPIDLLITFAQKNNAFVNLFAASCRAKLKVGRHIDSEKFLDMTIRSGDEVRVFTLELLKYLKQFNSN